MICNNLNVFKSTIIGIKYLRAEAIKQGSEEIAQLLDSCAMEIWQNFENLSGEPCSELAAMDPSMAAAIEFINSFALIDSKKRKKEILAEIEKLETHGTEH